MTVLYGKFELPEKIETDKADTTPTFSRFIAEPLERGFGHTIGNSLRRLMLSALEAPAILSVLIEGVPHEYMAVEGVVEDMTNIILNFKGALLRRVAAEGGTLDRKVRVISTDLDITQAQIDEAGGQYGVKLGDVIQSSELEVVNPDLHLFYVTTPFQRRVQVRIGTGRGYVPSERHNIPDRLVDEIPIDALYSPVRLVNYHVEHTRVGQDTDFDRLILEVTTDGRISPREALSFAAQIANTHFAGFQQVQEEEISFERPEVVGDSDREEMMGKLALRVGEIELSVRSTNCLKTAGINTIGELVVMSESEMLRFRNFGKKSLGEIKAKLEELELGFGLDLSQYGITRDNVAETVEQYRLERQSEEDELELGIEAEEEDEA